MSNINPILHELKDISPVVAAIGHQPTYTVPQGYFEGLATHVMLRIAIEEKAGTDPVLNISKDNLYQVPQGYFDGLAASVLNRIKTQETDKQTAEPALDINKDNLYEVPKGYFDGLAGNIINRIKAQETENPKEEIELLSPLLGGIGKKNPFVTPEGYFNDISDNIVAGVKAIDFVNEELENLSPVMLALKDKQVYEVPAGYFDNTVDVILKKVRNQQPAKAISIGFGKKMMRYAAAAVVTGLIATGAWMYFKPTAPADTIASIEQGIKKATDAEILNFSEISTASMAEADTTAATAGDITEKDSKDLLANISDEELQQYATDQHLETPITN